MTFFDLHAQVLADDRDSVFSFLAIADERARAFVEEVPEPSSAMKVRIER